MNKSKFSQLVAKKVVEKTIKSIKNRGISVELVANKNAALKLLKNKIPAGAELMTGGSTTLEEIGFIDLLKSSNHKWNNLKDRILGEKNPTKQALLRQKSITADYFIGSVHAVVETGEILIASASGSQLPSYAFSSNNVIWIVGTQKIVPTLEKAFKRLKEHCFPLEDKRMKSIGYPGSTIGKILLFEREIMPNRKLTLIFVNEKLGF